MNGWSEDEGGWIWCIRLNIALKMSSGPILLCYDASEEAAAAIAAAAERLSSREAIVVTVQETIAKWEPDGPRDVTSETAAMLDSLDPDDAAAELSHDVLRKGVELARAAGFDAGGRAVGGKTWRAICDLADELDASTIVLGARGLSRVQSVVITVAKGPTAALPP